MGRWYSGDIEGKFWFGVQSSDCMEKYGAIICDPSHIDYKFDYEDRIDIAQSIYRLYKDKRTKLTKAFFKQHGDGGYNDEMLVTYLHSIGEAKHIKKSDIENGWTRGAIKDELKDYYKLYADYEMLLKAYLYMRETKCDCYFDAEL